MTTATKSLEVSAVAESTLWFTVSANLGVKVRSHRQGHSPGGG